MLIRVRHILIKGFQMYVISKKHAKLKEMKNYY